MNPRFVIIGNRKGGVGTTSIGGAIVNLLIESSPTARKPMLVSVDEQHNLARFFEGDNGVELVLASANPSAETVKSIISLKTYYEEAGIAIGTALEQGRDVLLDIGANTVAPLFHFLRVIDTAALVADAKADVTVVTPILPEPGAFEGAAEIISLAREALPTARVVLAENGHAEVFATYKADPDLIALRNTPGVYTVKIPRCECLLWHDCERLKISPMAMGLLNDSSKALAAMKIKDMRARNRFHMFYPDLVDWAAAVQEGFAPVLGFTIDTPAAA